MHALSDAELVGRVVAGDVDLYAELIRRHQKLAYHVAYTFVGDADVAADMVQDALIRAYAALDQCRDRTRFRTWLLRAVRNRCLDYLKERRRQDVPLETHHAETMGGGEDGLQRLADRSMLTSALDELPSSLREAFLLRHVQELPYEEIASLLGTTTAGVKMRVSRARDLLRAALEAEGAPAGSRND
jgi:RNA polymerase sigma-70 factor, ECF subfamily